MRALVLTVSDRVSRGQAEDGSGPAAARVLAGLGFDVETSLVPDGIESVSGALQAAVTEGFPLVVTTGGTGLAPRDLTPEATRLVLEREAPGLSEAMRAIGAGANPKAMLSRGVSGVAGSTLIVNLPGSVAGVEESLDALAPVLRHAVDQVLGGVDGH
jgi:molybdenum cofactor synthesis domain-containing protein